MSETQIKSNFGERRKLVSRYLLCLFCHDFLFEGEALSDLSMRYVNYLFSLLGNDDRWLLKLIGKMTSVQLGKTIEGFANSIALMILSSENENISSEIVICISVLDYFHKANKISQIVDDKEFINDTVSNNLNLNLLATKYYNYKNKPNQFGQKPFLILEYPWLFSTEAKVDVLQVENYCSQNTQVMDQIMSGLTSGNIFGGLNLNVHLSITVRRTHILEDSLNKLSNQGKNLKKPLKIAFLGEAGVDAGGVRKEFFGLLTKELFNPQYAMFSIKNERWHWFNNLSLECKINFELIGTLIGLAIYNSVLLDLNLPKVVYKKLVGEEVSLADIEEFDPQLFTTLTNIAKAEKVADMHLDFSVSYDNYGTEVIVDLIENGRNIAVTDENKTQFIDEYVDWFLNSSIKSQFGPFYEGFFKVISKESIKVSLFSSAF